MKIAISSVGKSKGDKLDVRFGRCNFFQVYTTENDSYVSIENRAQNEDGGAGIAAAQQVIDEGVEVLITGNLGPNAYKLLERAQIKTFKSNSIPVEKVIELYKSNELSPLTEAGPAHHGMGMGARHRGGR